MNIGIDVRVLEKGMTGIGRFLLNILKHLPRVDKTNKYYLFSYGKPYQKDNYYFSISTGRNLLPKIYAPIWLNYVLPGYLRRYNIDVFFSPNNFVPITYRTRGCKYIAVVHDIAHTKAYNYHSLWYRTYKDVFLPYSLKKTDIVITVSEYSKREITSTYDIPPERTYVIYEAADEKFKPTLLSKNEKMEVRKTLGLPEEFILYVGVVERRKNIHGLMQICDLLKEKGTDIPLVVVGRLGFGGRRLYYEIKKRTNVIYLDYVEDRYLPLLYNMAKVFILPSFYEGFGLPALEALQSGLPVLTSNTSSLPEVVGDAGIMHHPEDYDSFARDIASLLKDSTSYQERRKKSITQAKKFDGKKSVQQLVRLLGTDT